MHWVSVRGDFMSDERACWCGCCRHVIHCALVLRERPHSPVVVEVGSCRRTYVPVGGESLLQILTKHNECDPLPATFLTPSPFLPFPPPPSRTSAQSLFISSINSLFPIHNSGCIPRPSSLLLRLIPSIFKRGARDP